MIVDNGSDPRAVLALRTTCSRLGAHLIANSENLGIAAALNQGVAWVGAQGFAWALTLDQDTVVHGAMLDELAAVYDAVPCADRLAIIGSNYWDSQNPDAQPVKGAWIRGPWVEARHVITSGSLTSLAAYRAVGPFKDELFIDLVDVEYCFRARAAGYAVVIATKVLMEHPIGASTARRLGWKEIRPTNHPAWRRYFMVRNYVLVARHYFRREVRWTILNLFYCIKAVAVIWLFEAERLEKLGSIALGLRDGVAGRVCRKPIREGRPSAATWRGPRG